MELSEPGVAPAVDLLALLDADPHGCALARSVRGANGDIVDFTLVYLNDAGGEFLGRRREELIGHTYRQLWPETVTDGTLPFYRQVVHDRVSATRTVYYDRQTVAGHFEIRVVPFGDGFVARFVDLTKLTIGSQTEGGARLYDALDAAFDGFTLLRAQRDDTGTIVDFVVEYVNQTGAKLAGKSVEELVGRSISESSGRSGEVELLDHCRQVADDGTPWQRHVTSTVTTQVWEIRIVRVDVVGVVAVSYRDITAQVEQQEQLARSADQTRAAADRTAALQTVTAALAAASTPHEVYAAMGTVVRPSAGGHGIVVLLAEPGRLVLAYHAGYEDEVVDQLRELPLAHPYPATQVSITGQPRYICSPEEFAQAQPDPRTAVSGGGRAAWAFLPLTTGGQTLGTLVVGYRRPRHFDEDERANLVAFSRLAAQALQRSLLYQAQLSIAADLQRALLPAVLPRIAGVRHAVRYLPWTHGADVGGDWYDVIQVGPDTAAVVIGDVAGHSPHAAATMGQLRNALRAYAADGHSPSGVMQRANQLLQRFEPDAMATCCYLELHPSEGTATAVLAGHPPPVLRLDGHVGHLPLRPEPPLGVRNAHYVGSTFLLPKGSSLLLYTDGLVEDRRYTLDQGFADLFAAVRAAPTDDPHDLVEHVLRTGVGPHPRRDDVAVLALTIDADPPPGPRTARRHFRGETASTAAARRFTRDILTAWGQQALRDDACLLLDELITNAIQHTADGVDVGITLSGRLRIDVHDRSDRLPEMRPVGSRSETGRGLHIIDRIADAWGTMPHAGTGKTVWFELESAADGQ